MSDFGIFNVSTEGDVEGRSSVNLGIFQGNMDDIALHLADKVYYTLHFSEYRSPTIYIGPYSPKRFGVQVSYKGKNFCVETKDTRAVELALLQQKPVSQMNKEEKQLLGQAFFRGEI